VNAFFGIMTMVIAIPTGVKVFNWLFTMYKGRIEFMTPMWWFMAFATTFLIGGATGVLLAVPAIDFQVHNSLFLVAHFHNTIISGVVFGYLAGIAYWFPKIFGFRLHERLGKAAVTCWVVGFLVTFIPIYILGFMGATLVCDDYGVTKIVNMSNIDMVYEKDPKKFPDAKPIKEASWSEFRELVGDKWIPGMNAPFDPIAAKNSQELELTTVIVNGKNLDNLQNYMDGKEFVGTVITGK
jgi:hypothetical protein